MLRTAFFGIPILAMLLGACMKEPQRVVEYDVTCTNCTVEHLDADGVSRTDTVIKGFLMRFQRDVGEQLELTATSLVNDSTLKARINVDYSEYKVQFGSGTPQKATLSEEVPKRNN